jgi:hypothetical protein
MVVATRRKTRTPRKTEKIKKTTAAVWLAVATTPNTRKQTTNNNRSSIHAKSITQAHKNTYNKTTNHTLHDQTKKTKKKEPTPHTTTTRKKQEKTVLTISVV